jgi:hypothetical protein
MSQVSLFETEMLSAVAKGLAMKVVVYSAQARLNVPSATLPKLAMHVRDCACCCVLYSQIASIASTDTEVPVTRSRAGPGHVEADVKHDKVHDARDVIKTTQKRAVQVSCLRSMLCYDAPACVDT